LRTRHDPDYEIDHLRLDHAARLRFHNLIRALAAWDFFAAPMSGFFVLAATPRSQNTPRKIPNKNRLQV